MSPLHLLVPLVAVTHEGGRGRVINEHVAHYHATMETLAKGLPVQVWCQRSLVGISGNMTLQSYHLLPSLTHAVTPSDKRTVILRDTHSACELMTRRGHLDGGAAEPARGAGGVSWALGMLRLQPQSRGFGPGWTPVYLDLTDRAETWRGKVVEARRMATSC